MVNEIIHKLKVIMKFSKIFISFWIIALSLIFIGSVLPHFAPTEKYHFDKLVHFTAYFTMSLLPTIYLKRNRLLFSCLAFLIFISVIIEVIQTHIPGRMGSTYDAITNIAGIVIGFLIGKIFINVRK